MNKVVRMIRRYLLWWLVLAGMMSELRDAISKDTSDIQVVRTLLRREYVSQLHDSVLNRPTIDSIAKGCDRYTNLIPPKHQWWYVQDYRKMTRRPGLRLRADSLGVYIRTVDPHSPAYAAGLTYRDRLVAVNGDTSGQKNAADMLRRIVTCTEQFLTLTVRRGVQEKTVVVPLSPLPNVQAWDYVHDTTAYIRIEMFTDVTGDSVTAMIYRYVMMNVRRIVLDLRGCSGGRYEQAVDVVRHFAKQGDTISIARRRLEADDVYRATMDGCMDNMLLDVLVDRNTGSGAEVVALAISSNGYGRVLGERTFGKGVMQTVFDLPSGSKFKMTCAYLQGARGTCIDKTYGENGLKPKLSFEPDLLSADTLSIVAQAMGDLVNLRSAYPQPSVDAVHVLRTQLPAPLRGVRDVYLAAVVWTDIGKLWWVARQLESTPVKRPKDVTGLRRR